MSQHRPEAAGGQPEGSGKARSHQREGGCPYRVRMYNQWTRKFENATREPSCFVFDSERVPGYVYKVLNQVSNVFEQAIFSNNRWQKYDSPVHNRLLQQGPPSPGQMLGQPVSASPVTQALSSEAKSLGESALKKQIEGTKGEESQTEDSPVAHIHRVEPLSTFANQVSGKLLISSVEGKVMTIVDPETGPILAENLQTGEIELVQLRAGRFEVVRSASQIREMVQTLQETTRQPAKKQEKQQITHPDLTVTQVNPARSQKTRPAIAQSLGATASPPTNPSNPPDSHSFLSENKLIHVVSPPRAAGPRRAEPGARDAGTSVGPSLAESSAQPSIQSVSYRSGLAAGPAPTWAEPVHKRPTVVDFCSIQRSVNEYLEYALAARRNERVLEQLSCLARDLRESSPAPSGSFDINDAREDPSRAQKASRLFTTDLSVIGDLDALEELRARDSKLRKLLLRETRREEERKKREQMDQDPEQNTRGVESPGRKPARAARARSAELLKENKRYIKLMEEAKREGVERELRRIQTEKALKERFQKQMAKLIELECRETLKSSTPARKRRPGHNK